MFLYSELACVQDTLVIDTIGEWLGRLKGKCSRLEASHLRLPVTQCPPHKNPLALQAFCEAQSLQQVLFFLLGDRLVPLV